MKKIITIALISTFVIASCQEASSIVAPNTDTKLEKKSEEIKFSPTDQDSTDLPKAPGRPIIVRV